MARPCKSAKLLTECSQTKAETEYRVQAEEKLRGKANALKPPAYLAVAQKAIFRKIVGMLKAAEILGAPDVYLVAQCAIAIDRLQIIEELINGKPEELFNSNVISARNAYTRDFFRCCNELSLSPQSRAKLGNIALQAEQEKQDPLLRVLKGGAPK